LRATARAAASNRCWALRAISWWAAAPRPIDSAVPRAITISGRKNVYFSERVPWDKMDFLTPMRYGKRRKIPASSLHEVNWGL
jgi:hypothetical protein